MPSRSSYSTWLTTSCDVGGQVDLGADQVHPLADPGQAGREDLVSLRLQPTPDVAEAVRAAPRAVHQDVRRHRSSPPRRSGGGDASEPAQAGSVERGREPAAHAGPPVPPAVEAGHAPHRLPHRHEGRLSRLDAPAHELAATTRSSGRARRRARAARPLRARRRPPPTGPAPGRWRRAASRSGRRRAGRPPARTSGPSAPGRSWDGPARRSRSRGARRPPRRGTPRSRGRRRCGRRRGRPPPSGRRLAPRSGSAISVLQLAPAASKPNAASCSRRISAAMEASAASVWAQSWVGRHGHGALDEDQSARARRGRSRRVRTRRRSRRRGGRRGSGGWRPSAGSRGGARAGRSGARRRRSRHPRPAPPRPRPSVWPRSGSPRREWSVASAAVPQTGAIVSQRSPLPDVEIPDVPLTTYVLGSAGERADEAALDRRADGPGDDVRRARPRHAAAGRRAAGEGLRQRRRPGDHGAEPAGVRRRLPRRRDGRRDDHHHQPEPTPSGRSTTSWRTPARRCW